MKYGLITLAGAIALAATGCAPKYQGPKIKDVKTAISSALAESDKASSSSSLLSPAMQRRSRTHFADKLRDVRFMHEKKCEPLTQNTSDKQKGDTGEGASPEKSAANGVYLCDVYIGMTMHSGRFTSSARADTAFEGKLKLQRVNGQWELLNRNIATQMIVKSIMHKAGVGGLFQ